MIDAPATPATPATLATLARAARRALRLAALVAAALATTAHVGTNDALFDGRAGPYAVRVSVRPPGVVPGLAQITVRVADPAPAAGAAAGVARVLVQAAQWNVGTRGAPAPDVAAPVAGERGLYAAELWLMTSGSYVVNVTVEGALGRGTVTVPIASVATTTLGMQRALGGVLAVLGALLVAGLVTIVGAAAREGVLAPGQEPDRRRRRVGRVAMAAAAALAAVALLGGSRWWSAVDRDYRRALYRPLDSEANVASTAAGQVLRFTITDTTWGTGVYTPLIPDHGKLMHLFVVREPALDVFAHLHPSRLDSATFDAPLPPLPAGRYRVYADIVHESGFSRTLVASAEISAPPAAHAGTLPDSLGEAPRTGARGDDAWLVATGGAPSVASDGGSVALGDGLAVAWRADGPIVAGRETTLRFHVRDSSGVAATLEPYMGMAGHLMISRADGAVFVHLHPMGTISIAAQQRLLRRERGDTVLHGADQPLEPDTLAPHAAHAAGGVAYPGDVSFPFAFPRPGAYRMWLQVKQGGRVRTAPFDVAVRGAS